MDWTWLREDVMLDVHDMQLAEHGGSPGIRDRGLFDSAMARPLNLAAYGGDEVDAAALAAAYGFGIARNHAFVDGNKRTAFVAIELFLALNGWELQADDAACVAMMESVAGGTMSEADLTQWLRAHMAAEA